MVYSVCEHPVLLVRLCFAVPMPSGHSLSLSKSVCMHLESTLVLSLPNDAACGREKDESGVSGPWAYVSFFPAQELLIGPHLD